jgi:hypothetical protein
MLSKYILTQAIGEKGLRATYLQELLRKTGLYDFHWNIRRTMDRRALFTTEDGDIGNAFHEIRVGDLVCLFAGARLPLVETDC